MNSRRGLLQIPQGVKPELFKDENFGIIGLSSADDVYVHAAPPAKDYQPNPKHRTQAIAKDGKFPAYLVDENAEPVSLVNEKLKKGQEVLARKIPGLKGIYEVVVFKPVENKITGMPETGDGIELVTKGFVREDQLQKSTHFPFIKPKKEQFKESSKDIFPNENLNFLMLVQGHS